MTSLKQIPIVYVGTTCVVRFEMDNTRGFNATSTRALVQGYYQHKFDSANIDSRFNRDVTNLLEGAPILQ